MNISKKILSLLLAIMLLGVWNMTAFASETNAVEDTQARVEENTNKPFLALGADLTAEQRAIVLGLMGLTEADLPNLNVVYITNEQEHQYLDAYVSSSVIGSKSLSSVLVKESAKGRGVTVSTKNITYCTIGMYRNALLTAGVEDAEILVVGPTQISGTAGLIGAIKAYEAMSGETVSDAVLDTALNELVSTGEIAADSLYSQEIEELIAYIKAKIAAGELTDEEDIRNAIEEGQNQFGVSLTAEEIQKIVELMNKINELGLDPEALLNQAKDLYQKYGNDLFENPDKAIGEIVKSAVSNFFTKIGDSIINFFKGLFS